MTQSDLVGLVRKRVPPSWIVREPNHRFNPDWIQAVICRPVNTETSEVLKYSVAWERGKGLDPQLLDRRIRDALCELGIPEYERK